MFRKRDADPMAKDDDDILELRADSIAKDKDPVRPRPAEPVAADTESKVEKTPPAPKIDPVPLAGAPKPKEPMFDRPIEPAPKNRRVEPTIDSRHMAPAPENRRTESAIEQGPSLGRRDHRKAETIPKAQPAPMEPKASTIDLSESKPLSASPKLSPASGVQTSGKNEAQANKRLIVGEGIRLSGEINSCDRWVVEGEVEVTLNDTLALEITSSGRFTGGCEVEEADISGVYEGDLTVRNTLFVRGTGQITGTIRYGQLELERGGQIAGNISVLGSESKPHSDSSAKARISKSPLFGDGKPA